MPYIPNIYGLKSRTEVVELSKKVRRIRRSMKRTGKSKNYIIGVAGLGCPNGRKKCRMCRKFKMGKNSRGNSRRNIIRNSWN